MIFLFFIFPVYLFFVLELKHIELIFFGPPEKIISGPDIIRKIEIRWHNMKLSIDFWCCRYVGAMLCLVMNSSVGVVQTKPYSYH